MRHSQYLPRRSARPSHSAAELGHTAAWTPSPARCAPEACLPGEGGSSVGEFLRPEGLCPL